MKSAYTLASAACLFGFVHSGLAQVTNWNAYNDFYYDSTVYANHSSPSTPPFPSTPSAAGQAWGYYDCNINLTSGYPPNIGSYFGPGGDVASGEVLYSMANYQPLGAGEGQLGAVSGSADSWDATGGSGLALYGDNQNWGTRVGEYGGAWYSGAPGYGTSHASDTGLYLQPAWLGNPASEGIGNVVTWTAPCDATYVFTCSFLIANNSSGMADYAVVDSLGNTEVPRTVGAGGTYNAYSFTNTYHAGDVVEFQAGSATNYPATIGFNANVQLVRITDWNAYNDFYFDSTVYANHSPGSSPPYPPLPSATGASWGYYDANVNGGVNGYPKTIGSYFGPGSNQNQNEVLYAMANYQPLGPGEGQLGAVSGSGDSWDAIGGTGLAQYGDNQGWNSRVGEYSHAWFPGAPGYGTPHAGDGGLYLVPAFLGNTSDPAEGIANVITWTAPGAGTYNFTGDFLTADNNPGCDFAVVDSTGGVEVPRTVAATSSYNPFSFQTTLNAGDVVEFQVGSDFEAPSYVGFNCVINNQPTPAVLVSATRSITNAALINVKFAAPLYAASVADLANYGIPGVNVTAAALSPSDPTTILLTISPGLQSAATLTVNNVENNFGQLPVAADSQALINVPVYIPIGIGSPTNAAQDTFEGSGLSPYWQSGIVNDDSSESNYVFANDFVWSNGVLHCHADNQVENPVSYWDPNYLIYENPAYEGSVQNALIHLTVKNSNFSSTGVAGVGVGVPNDPYLQSPEGGDCLRTVPAGYGDSTNTYPFFLSCSDYVIDEPVPQNTNKDVFNLSWQVGGSYWLRIQQAIDTNPATSGNPGGIISVKAWPGDGSQPEPSNWQYSWKDPLPGGASTRSGYAGIRAGFGAGVIMDFDVDYFLVIAPGLPVIKPTLPAQLLPQIGLGIATGGGNLVLSWPAGVQSGYQLQSRTSLATGSWTNVNTPLVVNGAQNTVTVPAAGTQTQFFRLIQSQ